MNEWVLITGASVGIGREFARLFAADGCNLVLLARNEARLRELAVELEKKHGISTRVLPADLALPEEPERIFAELRETPITTLVNNAGFGWRGEFVRGDRKLAREMMQVNMDALVQLTHLFAQPMLAKGAGRILNVASTAAFQPGPFTNVYFASKAFVFSFSVALAEELAGTGVQVTVFCPGGTATEFFERAGMDGIRNQMYIMPADKVTRIGYRGFKRGKVIVTAGVLNKLVTIGAKCLPAQVTGKVVRKLNGK
jgi:short-subunit dehydrogenase